jgi:hypothetical protein
MKIHLTLAILCASGIQIANAQARSCLVLELLNQVGWAIPALDRAVPKVVDAKVKMPGIPEDVFVDILEPGNHDAVVTLVRCVSDQPGRVEVRNQPIRVKELLRFKKYGRVFAYRINAGLIGGNGVALGTAEVLLFYDPDGSGRFTIQRDVAGALIPIIVPAWVQELRAP